MKSQAVMDVTLSSQVTGASRTSTAEPGWHHRCERTGSSGSTDYTADNLLMANKNRSSARGKARIRWPVAADSRRDGAIVAKIDKSTTDATG